MEAKFYPEDHKIEPSSSMTVDELHSFLEKNAPIALEDPLVMAVLYRQHNHFDLSADMCKKYIDINKQLLKEMDEAGFDDKEKQDLKSVEIPIIDEEFRKIDICTKEMDEVPEPETPKPEKGFFEYTPDLDF